MKKLLIFIFIMGLCSIAQSQTGKPQQGYSAPFQVKDVEQQRNNEDFARVFQTKRLQVSIQDPTNIMEIETVGIQDDGTNIIFWFKSKEGVLYGIELSSAPVTVDQ